jgi:hypothetical protein
MISLIPFVHTALEFRLQFLCKAMCLSKQPIQVSSNLWICNKHGIRKFNSVVAYRFFSALAYNKYGFNYEKHTFVKSGGKVGWNEIHKDRLCLLTLVNNPKIDQELLKLLFKSLEIASDCYNKVNEVNTLNLRSTNGHSYYTENDSKYYDINNDYITPQQRAIFKEPVVIWNRTVKGIEALSFFASKLNELIKTLDNKLSAYYVAGELKKK